MNKFEEVTKKRRQLQRSLPPVGTILKGRYLGREHEAKVVSAPQLKEGRGVQVGNEMYSSLSGAARAIAGHSVNGWVFWKF